MAHLTITDHGLVVTLSPIRRVFGRLRPLTVAWHHVTDVRPGAVEARRFPGVRWGVSSYIPGVLALGSFRTATTRDFWDVSDAAETVVVELTGHKYDRLLLQVADPDATVAALTARIGTRPG